jgi:hypothetical protein
MAYLIIGETTVPVVPGSPRMRQEPIGEVRRAFSGIPRSSVRDYFRMWEGVETRWLTRTEGDALFLALRGTPPLQASGDMVDGDYVDVLALNVERIETGRAMVDGVNTEMVRLSFDLWETEAL